MFPLIFHSRVRKKKEWRKWEKRNGETPVASQREREEKWAPGPGPRKPPLFLDGEGSEITRYQKETIKKKIPARACVAFDREWGKEVGKNE